MDSYSALSPLSLEQSQGKYNFTVVQTNFKNALLVISLDLSKFIYHTKMASPYLAIGLQKTDQNST